MICLHHSLILSLYLPSLHPCPQGTVKERIKNKGKGQKHSGPIILRGIEEMEATSFPLPIIFIWPPYQGQRVCRGSGDPEIRLRNIEMPPLIWGCPLRYHTTHSHRHGPILPPNKTIIKQHACPPGPIKAFYTGESVKEGKIISSLIMVLIPYG